MSVMVYGLSACSTVQKALGWLDAHGIAYSFHDFKTQGADEAKLNAWCKLAGWEKVMNRASLTYRGLSAGDKENLDQAKAIVLMMAKPTLIRRPVLETGETVLRGFSEKQYRETFGVSP
ncbi:MAG: arsenate reductase [Rhizomicrobium sp.]